MEEKCVDCPKRSMCQGIESLERVRVGLMVLCTLCMIGFLCAIFFFQNISLITGVALIIAGVIVCLVFVEEFKRDVYKRGV